MWKKNAVQITHLDVSKTVKVIHTEQPLVKVTNVKMDMINLDWIITYWVILGLINPQTVIWYFEF